MEQLMARYSDFCKRAIINSPQYPLVDSLHADCYEEAMVLHVLVVRLVCREKVKRLFK